MEFSLSAIIFLILEEAVREGAMTAILQPWGKKAWSENTTHWGR